MTVITLDPWPTYKELIARVDSLPFTEVVSIEVPDESLLRKALSEGGGRTLLDWLLVAGIRYPQSIVVSVPKGGDQKTFHRLLPTWVEVHSQEGILV